MPSTGSWFLKNRRYGKLKLKEVKTTHNQNLMIIIYLKLTWKWNTIQWNEKRITLKRQEKWITLNDKKNEVHIPYDNTKDENLTMT